MSCIKILCGLILVMSLTACATAKKELSARSLQMRVGELEKDIEVKNQEILSLRQELSQVKQKGVESYSANKAVEEKSLGKAVKSSPKKIQKALKKADFYTGPIDGKIGKRTRRAIKEFQKANNLTADGKVGKKTWAKLKQYLN